MADNLKAFVSLVGRKRPASKILLLGILPRKEKALAPLIVETNEMTSVLADGKGCFYQSGHGVPGRRWRVPKGGCWWMACIPVPGDMTCRGRN